MTDTIGSLCVGCAKDLSDCSRTRKKLGADSKASDQAKRTSILSTWRDLAADFSVLQNCSTWNDALLMMCKKCYNDYDKLVKLKRSIMRNLTVAAEKLVDVSSSIPKRRRVAIDDTIVVQGPDDSATASSPAVMVTYGYGKNIIWGNYDGVGQIVLS